MAPIAYMTNVISICAAHRLHNPDLSDEENQELFGKCNHINSHGHNYKFEVTVAGEVMPKSGYAMNLRDLKDILIEVTDPMDHHRIDTDISFFRDGKVVATAENIGIYVWQEVEKRLPAHVRLHNVRVIETDKNFIDYRGE